jgi:CDP-4-dehydro-6-deoxyglucose reductase
MVSSQMNVRASLANSDLSFSVAPDQTVLDAALAAGIHLPQGCKGGHCGACRARLVHGEIRYPNGPPLGLSDAEAAAGFVLLCHAHARTDLLLDTVAIRAADTSVSQRLPGRIERAERLSHDVLALFVRLPPAASFAFEAGQYIDILLPDGRRRSFSIASPPHDSRLLELHVRHAPGGALTDRLFAQDPRNMLLSIDGPLGRFFYREGAGAPLLLVGGGTGLAPLKSIVRHVIEQGLERSVTLYWGVRAERDLYAHAELEALARRAANFHYCAVLSEGGLEWAGRRGWVHEAVLADLPALDRYEIYVSGPPAMIGAVRREFARGGANLARLYADSFDYAPDTLARQRATAATRA